MPDRGPRVLIPGRYRMVGGFVNTLRIEREPGVPGWPYDLVANELQGDDACTTSPIG